MRYYKRDPDAALAGMNELTLEERGAYNTILDMLYGRDGCLPDDDAILCTALGCHGNKWNAIKRRLVAKGKIWVVDNMLKAKRVDETIGHAVAVSEKQRANVAKRWATNERETPEKTSRNAPETGEKPNKNNGGRIPYSNTLYSKIRDSQLRKDSQKNLFTESQSQTESHSGRRRAARQQIRDDWEPDEKGLTYAAERSFTGEKLAQMIRACRDYHIKHGTLIAGERGLAATWRTWCDNEVKFNAEGARHGYRRSGALQDDSKSISRAAHAIRERIESGEQYVIPPRPKLFGEQGGADLQLLPKGRGA